MIVLFAEVAICQMVTSTPKMQCVKCKCVFEPTILIIEIFAYLCTYMVIV
jgi:hypothetical protein